MSKNLILYYSREGENYWEGGTLRNLEKGNTQYVAEFIRDAVGGDLFRIETVQDYPAEYKACTEAAMKEQKAGARPELKEYLAGQLERLDLAGKTLFPVMTHEGSGLGSSARTLKKVCRKATVGKGLAVQGSKAADSRDTVTEWARCCVAWHES